MCVLCTHTQGVLDKDMAAVLGVSVKESEREISRKRADSASSVEEGETEDSVSGSTTCSA